MSHDLDARLPIKRTKAFAKINLTLAITGRRDNGYHELNSLVAFAGCHDLLSLTPHDHSASLSVRGVFIDQMGENADNLILKAARHMAMHLLNAKRAGHFELTKRLPIGGGIGGGSSDAAAALRLLAQRNNIPLSAPELMKVAQSVGADVPVCIEARARFMSGVGEVLGAPIVLPPLYAVLVTPPVHMATPRVFEHYNRHNGAQSHRKSHALNMPDSFPDYESVISYARSIGNDLTKSACELAPLLNDVLSAITSTPNCDYVSMSGSGATCFGIYKSCIDSKNASKMIKRMAPDWWVKSTRLR